MVFHEEQFPFQHFLKVSEPPAPSIHDDCFTDVSNESPTLQSPLPHSPSQSLLHIIPVPIHIDASAPISVLSIISQPLRRSSRLSKQPLWLKDYVSNPSAGNVLDPIVASISYDNLSPTYHTYLQAFYAVIAPTFYKEATLDNRWLEAMQAELQALHDNYTWDLVPLPGDKIPIGCKWVYKFKIKDNGYVERFKSRLVAKGYT